MSTSNSQEISPKSPLQARGSLTRPSEKVLHYISSKFDQNDYPARLPSIRRLAKHLDVSASTVQSVFQKLANEERIRVEAGTGSFLVGPPKDDQPAYQIGSNVPEHSGATPEDWTYNILGGILHGTLRCSRPMAFRPLPVSALADDRDADSFLKESWSMDGFILFPNRKFERRLQQICTETGRPCIHVNPPSECATANFVAPDYFGASKRLGLALRRAGRRKIALLMWPGPSESTSVSLRCAGFAAGAMEDFEKVKLRLYVGQERPCHAEIRKILQNDTDLPDAIYCSGDTSALAAVEAIKKNGLRVPEDISVVGGNGLGFDTSATHRLTAMRHPLDRLGREVVAMLSERLEDNGRPVPGRYLPIDFVIGDTTTPEENEYLAES